MGITIGLFGTCGSSKWREPFMKAYDEQGIKYFNPVKEDWKVEDAQIEAEHLANDEIICFPVTDETYAFGSLGEVGFSILQAIKLNQRREIIVMIDPDVKLDYFGKIDLAFDLEHEMCRREKFITPNYLDIPENELLREKGYIKERTQKL